MEKNPSLLALCYVGVPVEKMCKKKKEIKKLSKEMKRKNVTQKSQTLSLPDYQQIFA